MSKKKTSKKQSQRKWIQEAHLKKGALREYVKRNYGEEGFTNRGTIKVSLLRSLATNPKVTKKTRDRARAALTLRKLSTKRRKKKG